jgi:hypothetical protein
MRRLKKAGKLEDDKVTRLTMIGFEFVKASTETIAFSAAWHASFLQLKGKIMKKGKFLFVNVAPSTNCLYI